MSAALQKRDTASFVLARRELLNLGQAAQSLVTRARVRTPLGASEMLEMRAHFGGREGYLERLELVNRTSAIYSELFAREYATSPSASFSVEREHEFYRLVHERLFPLTLEFMEELGRNPRLFLPAIPVSCTQQHDWIRGCCGFDGIQTVFKLVRTLIQSYDETHDRHYECVYWRALCERFNLPPEPRPAAPLAAIGWPQFIHLAMVDGTPLKYLPLVFQMVGYQTGNIWLDAPPDRDIFLEWSFENIAKLLMQRRNAEVLNAQVIELNRWLDADPQVRLMRAIELWNNAAAFEAASPYAGMMAEEIFEALGE